MYVLSMVSALCTGCCNMLAMLARATHLGHQHLALALGGAQRVHGAAAFRCATRVGALLDELHDALLHAADAGASGGCLSRCEEVSVHSMAAHLLVT